MRHTPTPLAVGPGKSISMNFPPETPQKIAELGLWEAVGVGLSDWNLELDVLASARLENSPRYTAYHDFLGRYLLADSSTTTGFSLLDLTSAQKWILMFMTDMFFDYTIVYHGRREEWMEAWEARTEWVMPGYNLILEYPDSIDLAKLEETWGFFRAAVS